ncbi:MAG: hypothetical protein AAFQ23_00435 [Cyanobacteria bacterium J06623_1]
MEKQKTRQEQTTPVSVETVNGENEEWGSMTVAQLKTYINENGLNEDFGKFAGHGFRTAKKEEFVDFLNQL